MALIVDDLPAAAAYLETACADLKGSGNQALTQTLARLGYVLGRLGRHEEAEPFAERGQELADPNDVGAQVTWRQA
jgi:tetratricopeptide (TPR) repeat protein